MCQTTSQAINAVKLLKNARNSLVFEQTLMKLAIKGFWNTNFSVAIKRTQISERSFTEDQGNTGTHKESNENC